MSSIIDQKSVLFALEIIKLSKELNKTKNYILSKQILRSGTSIGANVRESHGVVSKKDFIHKLSISLKEAKETRYWLELMIKSELVNVTYLESLDSKCLELVKMLASSIVTIKKKYNL